MQIRLADTNTVTSTHSLHGIRGDDKKKKRFKSRKSVGSDGLLLLRSVEFIVKALEHRTGTFILVTQMAKLIF